jgi:glycosyltransferase involved in cell wall biosynthesis
MKALAIAPQPFFTPRGTPLSVYYRTLVTAELNVEVDLLTYGVGSDVEIPGVRIIRIPRFSWLGEIPVGPSMTKLFLDIFIFIWMVMLLCRHRYDFVHAHEEAVFFALILRPIFRFKLVYDMHSSLPQQLSNFKFTKSRLTISAFQRLELLSLRASSVVITICPNLADYALERTPEKDRVILIENTLFEEIQLAGDQKPGDGNAPSVAAAEDPISFPSNRRLIFYAGTLEAYQGIDLLLEAFRGVMQRCPDAFLVVIGGKPRQTAFYKLFARRLGIERDCHFTGTIFPNRVRQLYRLAWVHVSPRTAGTNTPSKIYEQLASGIPLVATDILAHTQVLDEEVAFLAPPNPSDLAESLFRAISDEAEREKRVKAAQRRYKEKYSRDRYVAKMHEVIDRIS